jgi:hypothetical protein
MGLDGLYKDKMKSDNRKILGIEQWKFYNSSKAENVLKVFILLRLYIQNY